MDINRFFRRRTSGWLVAALAIPGVLLLGGPANADALAAPASPAYPHSLIRSAPATTSTALVTSPASSITQSSPVTLTATLTPSTAVGTVQFKDGTTDLGPRVTVSNNGTAAGTTSMLPLGRHSLTAVFIPTNPTAYSSSTSPPVPLLVTASQTSGPTPPQLNLPDIKLPDLRPLTGS